MNVSSHTVVFAQFAFLVLVFFASTRIGLRFQRSGFRVGNAGLLTGMSVMIVSMFTWAIAFFDNSFGGIATLAVFAAAVGFMLETKVRSREDQERWERQSPYTS